MCLRPYFSKLLVVSQYVSMLNQVATGLLVNTLPSRLEANMRSSKAFEDRKQGRGELVFYVQLVWWVPS